MTKMPHESQGPSQRDPLDRLEMGRPILLRSGSVVNDRLGIRCPQDVKSKAKPKHRDEIDALPEGEATTALVERLHDFGRRG